MEMLIRRYNLAIYHFVANRELGDVQLGVSTSELLQGRAKP